MSVCKSLRGRHCRTRTLNLSAGVQKTVPGSARHGAPDPCLSPECAYPGLGVLGFGVVGPLDPPNVKTQQTSLCAESLVAVASAVASDSATESSSRRLMPGCWFLGSAALAAAIYGWEAYPARRTFYGHSPCYGVFWGTRARQRHATSTMSTRRALCGP